MSLKKDNYKNLDKKYMNFAIKLAENQDGLTGSNPSVGCVIVKNKKIVSFGQTNFNGRPHAETICLNKNKAESKGSTVYLTLEPCTHYGKTPPCTNALIKSKVKEVYYSIDDTDIRTNKKAKNILNNKKIIVKKGLLSKQVNKLYKKYNFVKKNNLPYVTGKLACSSNFFILKDKSFITNKHSRNVSHLLRYKNQGILTSYKTINSDNPKLNCRLNGLETFSPTKFIIDKDLKINFRSYTVKNSKNINTYIFHNSKNYKKIKGLKLNNLKLIKFDLNENGYFDLKGIFKKIYNLGYHNLLVECGKNLTLKMLSSNLFNEFYLFKSNKSLTNKNKVDISAISKNLNIFKNKNYVNTYLDKDILIHYY